MKRIINIYILLLVSLFVNAQKYKIIKVGGTAPQKPNGKVYKVGDEISNKKLIKWPQQESWLKILDIDNRKISYLSAQGESTKRSGITGNSELSCKTAYHDSDAFTLPFTEVGKKYIPQSFKLQGGEVTPNRVTLSNIELDINDEICISYFDTNIGKYHFRRIKVAKDANNNYNFMLSADMFPKQDKGTGIYISFYLVHQNNYALLKNDCVMWF